MKFIYVTVAAGDQFIKEYTQYALKSLLKHVDSYTVYCGVNTFKEKSLLESLVPDIKNVDVMNIKYKHIKWTYMKGKRKFSYFKAGAMSFLSKKFVGSYVVSFDGDVLFYRDPEPFLKTKSDKTWFHHGKDLQKRCSIPKDQIDLNSYDSVKHWVDEAWAYLSVKYNIPLSDREVVAGFYSMHPKDHAVFDLTWKYVQEISNKFIKGEGKDSVGEQKPFNAALSKLQIDWHGGSRFFCPEHTKYFDHFFGKKDMKKKFRKKVKKLGIQ